MKKILLMNGPNLNMLGIREPGVYGNNTLAELERQVIEYGAAHDCEVECFQSNHEATWWRRSTPRTARATASSTIGAHTHYSYALRDALGSVSTPCVEVHISDVDAREPFRRISVIAPACVAQVKGRGFAGYCDALDILLEGVTERLGEGYENRYKSGQVIMAGRDYRDE